MKSVTQILLLYVQRYGHKSSDVNVRHHNRLHGYDNQGRI